MGKFIIVEEAGNCVVSLTGVKSKFNQTKFHEDVQNRWANWKQMSIAPIDEPVWDA